MSGRSEVDDDRRDRLIRIDLRFGRRYVNLVRFDPEFCGRYPFNGLREASDTSPHPETCFKRVTRQY